MIQVRSDAIASEFARNPDELLPGPRADVHQVRVERSLRPVGEGADGFHGEQNALHAECETGSSQRRAAVLLDQIVVPASRADRVLSAQPGVHELKDGSRVVVQTPDQARSGLVRNPERVECGLDTVEVCPAAIA